MSHEGVASRTCFRFPDLLIFNFLCRGPFRYWYINIDHKNSLLQTNKICTKQPLINFYPHWNCLLLQNQFVFLNSSWQLKNIGLQEMNDWSPFTILLSASCNVIPGVPQGRQYCNDNNSNLQHPLSTDLSTFCIANTPCFSPSRQRTINEHFRLVGRFKQIYI